jgi:IS30 family transposase
VENRRKGENKCGTHYAQIVSPTRNWRRAERRQATAGQLSLEDRCEIARLSANGSSVRQIAAALDRSPSTISRELKRNRGAQVGYKRGYAQQQTKARRCWKGSRLERDESLRAAVIERLASGWSPEQIAGRLKREQRRKVISYESIGATKVNAVIVPINARLAAYVRRRRNQRNAKCRSTRRLMPAYPFLRSRLPPRIST